MPFLMSIKDKYYVESIPAKLTHEWLLKKHYAGRIPNIMFSFGLFDGDNILCGVSTFGMPPSSNLDNFIELNRLVVNDGLEKNTLSYFVSGCLKKLPKDFIIISFADPNHDHHGYIYQSTNWLYTGTSGTTNNFFLGNLEYHERHIQKSDKMFHSLLKKCGVQLDKNKTTKEMWLECGGTFEKQEGKHRYIYPRTKQQKKYILDKYSVLPYPKGDNKRYDTSYKPIIQTKLF